MTTLPHPTSHKSQVTSKQASKQALWALWMIPLPRTQSHKVTKILHQPGVLGSIPKREEPGKAGAPCVKVPGSSRVPRDEQTHPHRPRLVVSHSTCSPLSTPPPHTNSFVIGPAVIKHTGFRALCCCRALRLRPRALSLCALLPARPAGADRAVKHPRPVALDILPALPNGWAVSSPRTCAYIDPIP